MLTGSCLCGSVAFKIEGQLRDVLACHCRQCRKQSGHYWAASAVPETALKLTRNEGLAWFRASDTAQRGFCRCCGSTLFWKADNASRIAVGAGSLSAPTDLALTRHVFVADKGDYYEIVDGLPQYQQFSGAENA